MEHDRCFIRTSEGLLGDRVVQVPVSVKELRSHRGHGRGQAGR